MKSRFRGRLARGFVQVLTPDGVLLAAVPKRVRSEAPALASVDDEALRDA